MSNKNDIPTDIIDVRVTVDVVVFTIQDNQLKLLVITRPNEPFKDMLTLPGGFIRDGETAHDAVNRLMFKKTGVKKVFVEQLYTFNDLDRDPRYRTLSISYFAFVPEHKLTNLADGAELVSVQGLPKLGFDHNTIVDYAMGRARSKLEYTNAAYSLLPQKFTLSDLQNVYEIILGQIIDKRNFRKKILSLDMLVETDEMQTGKKHRPARLYTFKNQEVHGFDSPFVYSQN